MKLYSGNPLSNFNFLVQFRAELCKEKTKKVKTNQKDTFLGLRGGYKAADKSKLSKGTFTMPACLRKLCGDSRDETETLRETSH